MDALELSRGQINLFLILQPQIKKTANLFTSSYLMCM